MRHLALVLFLSSGFIRLSAAELTDHKSASDSLYKHGCNIDIRTQSFFGFHLGVSEGDLVKAIGGPSAVYETETSRCLFYGRDIALEFRDGKLAGVTAGYCITPSALDRSGRAAEPTWTVGKVRYGDKKKVVEDVLGVRAMHAGQSEPDQKEIGGIVMEADYFKKATNEIADYGQEFLSCVRIEKKLGRKDAPASQGSGQQDGAEK